MERGKWLIYFEKDKNKNMKKSRIENFINYEPKFKDFLHSRIIPSLNEVNKSKKARIIFYFTFNDITEGEHYDNYIIKKREIFPPDIEREGKEIKFKGTKYNLANQLE